MTTYGIEGFGRFEDASRRANAALVRTTRAHQATRVTREMVEVRVFGPRRRWWQWRAKAFDAGVQDGMRRAAALVKDGDD